MAVRYVNRLKNLLCSTILDTEVSMNKGSLFTILQTLKSTLKLLYPAVLKDRHKTLKEKMDSITSEVNSQPPLEDASSNPNITDKGTLEKKHALCSQTPQKPAKPSQNK